MAVKTIKIDVEAYQRLKSAKKPDESFSQTIKRMIRKPVDLEEWFGKMARVNLPPKAIAAIEEEVKNRRKPINRERGRAVP